MSPKWTLTACRQPVASPSLAFLVQWVSGTSSDFGTPMSDTMRANLIHMATLAATDLGR